MSGGALDDYGYFRLHDTIEAIEQLIIKNNSEQVNDWGKKVEPYSEETIIRFKEAALILKQAYIYAHAIDWLESGDYNEPEFHEQLNRQLQNLEIK